MRETILITGVAGFIGSHLARRLIVERGAHVVGVDNFDPFYDRALKERNLDSIPASRFTIHDLDIRDGDSMRACAMQAQPRAIVHIAALAGVRPSIAEPARYADVNVNGTVSVLEAARAADCPDVIFASSSSVYGNRNGDGAAFAEDDDISRPISPYAATKCAGEAVCHAYAHLFGLRIACMRFFTVYGPRQRPDLAISKFMRLIARGESVPMFGDGSTARDYTFIEDITRGLMMTLDHLDKQAPGFSRVYNLGNSSPVLLSELIDTIARMVGKPARIDTQPMQPGDVERTFADLTRVRTEIGWKPRASLEDGLERQWAEVGLATSRS